MNGEKLPPHDVNAEEAVNGSLLIDGTSIYKVANVLQPQDFYHEQNQLIYEACLAIYQRNESINQVTIAHELDRQQKLEASGGAAYLSYLIANCPTSLDIETYAHIVYRLSVMRRLINAADRIAAVGYQAGPDVDASLNRAEDVLYQLRHGQTPRDLIHIRQLLDKYFEPTPPPEADAEEVHHALSGFHKLDEFLGGFQRSDLIVVAGRPSMGKTSFVLSAAINAAIQQKACVALFSMEMARDMLVTRMLSSVSGIDSRRVRLELQTENEEKHIMEAIGTLSEVPVYIDDSPQLRMVEMRSKARRLSFEQGIDLIIVDYLQLIHGDTRTENRVQEIGYVSRSLKALARELNVPVIAVSQLTRAAEWRVSHRPQLSDLRESGSIEQDADVVILIYRDDYYFTEEAWEKEHPDKEYPRGVTNLIVAKNRNGPTGEIDLHFLAKTAKFEDIPTTREPSLL